MVRSVSLALLVLTFALGLATAQQQGCNCDEHTGICSCCASAPGVPFLSVCATMHWDQPKGNIEATVSFSGAQFPTVIFNKTNPEHCIPFSDNPPTAGCFDLKNYTITPAGTCGEFYVDLKVFLDIAFPLGVFKFGDTGTFTCPTNPYPPTHQHTSFVREAAGRFGARHHVGKRSV